MRRNTPIFIAVAAVAIIALGAAWWYREAQIDAEREGDLAGIETAAPGPDIEAAYVDAMMPISEATTSTEPAPAVDAFKDIKVTVYGNDPTAPRSIGDANAPVTITEYASLTCPHCAKAHETIIPQLIKDYVETGKVRIIFNDFPLNKEALDGSKVSRCVPNDQYLGFMTILFGSIEQWAYSNNHPGALLQNATMTGLTLDEAKKCLESDAIEQAILKGVQDGITNYTINSTPTFVFNNGAKKLMGSRPYAEFQAAIEELSNAGPMSTPTSKAE